MFEWLRAGLEALTSVFSLAMTARIVGKAATMKIPIHRNGEAGPLPEDGQLEQDFQQVMGSGPNLSETSIVSGDYGASGDGATGSGRQPSHSTSPSGPSDEVAQEYRWGNV